MFFEDETAPSQMFSAEIANVFGPLFNRPYLRQRIVLASCINYKAVSIHVVFLISSRFINNWPLDGKWLSNFQGSTPFC